MFLVTGLTSVSCHSGLGLVELSANRQPRWKTGSSAKTTFIRVCGISRPLLCVNISRKICFWRQYSCSDTKTQKTRAAGKKQEEVVNDQFKLWVLRTKAEYFLNLSNNFFKFYSCNFKTSMIDDWAPKSKVGIMGTNGIRQPYRIPLFHLNFAVLMCLKWKKIGQTRWHSLGNHTDGLWTRRDWRPTETGW